MGTKPLRVFKIKLKKVKKKEVRGILGSHSKVTNKRKRENHFKIQALHSAICKPGLF
jgi:hypothetical protein